MKIPPKGKKTKRSRPAERGERSKNTKLVKGVGWPPEKIYAVNSRYWDLGENETAIFRSGINPASFYRYVTTTRAEWEKMKANIKPQDTTGQAS